MLRMSSNIYFIALSLVLFLSGCANTNTKTNFNSEIHSGSSKIVVMPLDVELSKLTAIGAMEPNAEWTENAKIYLAEAVKNHLSKNGYQSQTFDLTSTDPESNEIQLQKLHEAVGRSILIHADGIGLAPNVLPTKKGGFKWTLGPSAKEIANQTGADYAMFVFLRDSYSTGGRVAAQIGFALLTGGALLGGQQLGFASLVHLETGDIVWFNFLHSTTGDVREPDSAAKTVENLLKDMP